VSFIELNAL